jgi:hypothetical protein
MADTKDAIDLAFRLAKILEDMGWDISGTNTSKRMRY